MTSRLLNTWIRAALPSGTAEVTVKLTLFSPAPAPPGSRTTSAPRAVPWATASVTAAGSALNIAPGPKPLIVPALTPLKSISGGRVISTLPPSGTAPLVKRRV